MRTGHNDLIWRRSRIAADQDVHRLHSGHAKEVFVGYAGATFFRESGVKQIRQDFTLLPAEPERDHPSAAGHAAIVILAQRMIVWNARISALIVGQAEV